VLRSFRVENHKSIRDEQELVFVPHYDKSRPVVPVTAIFGANASGKSNLLDALRWLQDAVRHSYASWEAGSGVPRTPFRLSADAAEKPSGYSVDLILDGLRHNYGVTVDDTGVREEWLSTYPRGRRRLIFERDHDRVKLGSSLADRRVLGDLLTRQTRDNALLLSVAAQNDVDEVQALYAWFRQAVAFGDAGRVDHDDLTRRLRDDRERSSLVSLIKAADLGIEDVIAIETVVHLAPGSGKSQSFLNLVQQMRRREGRLDLVITDETPDLGLSEIAFRHNGGRTPLTFTEQSAGTRSWLALVSQALGALDAAGVLVVDEVDASLHPHLSAQLIKLFREPDTNRSGAQLIFTTHDATLLDDDVLARDEIWFVEKDGKTGATGLYPLTQFHPRKNEDTEGRYLAGAYGAVPVLSGSDFRDAIARRREGE
jgi:predicted ATPase